MPIEESGPSLCTLHKQSRHEPALCLLNGGLAHVERTLYFSEHPTTLWCSIIGSLIKPFTYISLASFKSPWVKSVHRPKQGCIHVDTAPFGFFHTLYYSGCLGQFFFFFFTIALLCNDTLSLTPCSRTCCPWLPLLHLHRISLWFYWQTLLKQPIPSFSTRVTGTLLVQRLASLHGPLFFLHRLF